jgi:hypothetical protein
MSAPLRIEHLSACRAALLGRRHMNFMLVNGRTPRPQSFCARCCEPIGASYLREIATRLSYCDHGATPVKGNLPSQFPRIIRGRHDVAETQFYLLRESTEIEGNQVRARPASPGRQADRG